MKNNKGFPIAFAASLLTLSLAACSASGGPSKHAVQAALQKMSNQGVMPWSEDGLMRKMHVTLRSMHCMPRKDGKHTVYTCHTALRLSNPTGYQPKTTAVERAFLGLSDHAPGTSRTTYTIDMVRVHGQWQPWIRY